MSKRKPKPVIPSRDPNYDICRATGKRSYYSWSKAKRALANVREFGDGGPLPCRIYRCADCGGLHLTSIPRSVFRRSRPE